MRHVPGPPGPRTTVVGTCIGGTGGIRANAGPSLALFTVHADAPPPFTPLPMHGQFVWYELTTPDADAAKKFYPRFTGWGTQAFDKDYTMWTTGGVPLAGLFQLTDEMRQQGVPPNWLPYVESSNVDETVAKASSLGGRVVMGPADIPGVGRYAVVQDPQGATFGVYKSSNPMGVGPWDGTAVVGRFSWHELMTTDHVAAFEFYRTLFGWDKNGEMDMGGGQMYSMYGKGDKMYGGMFNRMPEMAGMPPFWLVYIHVKDVGKAVSIATKAGAKVQRPQMDIPGGSIAILGDPQGAGFALHHANAQVAEAAPAAKPAAKSAAKTSAKKSVKKLSKKVARTARRVVKKVTTAAKKAAKQVAKKVATVTKRGSKAVAKKAARKPAKKAATRPTPKVKAKAKTKASAARKTKKPNAPKRKVAKKAGLRRLR